MPGGAASGELVLPPVQFHAHTALLTGLGGPESGTPTLFNKRPPDASTSDGDKDLYWAAVQDLNAPSVLPEMATAAALNPYVGVASYDPSAELDKIDDAVDAFTDYVEDFDPELLLPDAIAVAMEVLDNSTLSEDDLTASVAAHRNRTEEAYQRRVSGASASLLAGRAVMSGGFDAMLTAMANQREAEIGDFSARLTIVNREQRTQYAIQFASQYVQIAQTILQARQAGVGLAQSAAQFRIIGEQDRITQDLLYDEEEIKWKLNLLSYGQNTIASFSGASTIPVPKNGVQKLLGGLGPSVTGAVGAGIGLGIATGNPLIGVLGGVAVAGLMGLSNVFN